MWAPWMISPCSVRSSRSRSRHFSCSSFKDIQDLCLEDQPLYSPPTSPKSPSVLHRVRLTTSVLRALPNRYSPAPTPFLPDSEHCGVVYHTSLRVVRKTFEDCRTARSILLGFRVSIDERDLSMDSRFQDELEQIVGRKNLSLPRVFIGGKYIGGADQVKELHESGELKRLIAGIPSALDPSRSCDLCGGVRYIICNKCNGSHKIYVEKSGFKSCTSCNTDGLIRCSPCSSVHLRLRSTTSRHETLNMK